MYMYMYVCMYVCIYIYIYIHIIDIEIPNRIAEGIIPNNMERGRREEPQMLFPDLVETSHGPLGRWAYACSCIHFAAEQQADRVLQNHCRFGVPCHQDAS